MRAVVLENDLLRVSVLPDKGADVYEFVYKPKDVDVLIKSPWGIKDPGRGIATANDSQVAWMEHWEGGWQEIFPSGGGPSRYKGVEIGFHGEVSALPWDYKALGDATEEAVVDFSVNTRRTPFRVERRMRLRRGDPRLYVDERITNWSEEEMDYMWGHHPTLGAPFLGKGAIIDVPARWVESQGTENEATRLRAGTRHDWPTARDKDGGALDLSVVPSEEWRSADLAFLGGLEEGWYAVTNPALGVGFGLVWPKEVFPYLWFWQEFRGSSGWPFYGSCYAMALEPFTGYDETGLSRCLENGTARRLAPGESIGASIVALCFEGKAGVERIDEDGTPHLRDA
jgi:hypothetical protein